ncbi:cytochrome c [Rapidithrix thailandica]|uniref:Cytochrome c n=1 Tax=Rapidithrix thailandica TaxID=413964 RepID=A0AAW9S5A0_9BACT
MMTLKHIISIILVCTGLGIIGCGGAQKGQENTTSEPIYQPKQQVDPMQHKGIGPVQNLELAALDETMAEEGKTLYEQYCTACHKATQKYIGPAPKDILNRRTPEWVMNMILNPEEMVQKDPIAKKLLVEFNGAPMANQHLTEEQARKILEYFRTL